MPEDKNQKKIKPTDTKIDLDMFLPRAVSTEQMEAVRQQFSLALGGGVVDPVDIFVIMYDYFSGSNFATEEVGKFSNTFWPLFVRVAWEVMPVFKKEIFVEVVTRTLPYAIAQFIEVKDKLIYYLAMKEVDEAQEIYNKLKQRIKALNYPISFNQTGKNIMLGQVIKKLSAKPETSDLGKFEMFVDIQKAFFVGFTTVEDTLIKQDETRRVGEFIDVLAFLSHDADVQIYINDYYVKVNDHEFDELDEDSKAALGGNLVRTTEGSAEATTKPPAREKPEQKKTPREISFAEQVSKQKNNFAAWSREAATLRSLLAWFKNFVDKKQARPELAKLLQTVLGEAALSDMETVLAIAQLDEFLHKNNYPGTDLIHFDENEEKFKWGK